MLIRFAPIMAAFTNAELQARHRNRRKSELEELRAELHRLRAAAARAEIARARAEILRVKSLFIRPRSGPTSTMTLQEYRLVLGLLHPDRHPESQRARYETAFKIFHRLGPQHG